MLVGLEQGISDMEEYSESQYRVAQVKWQEFQKGCTTYNPIICIGLSYGRSSKHLLKEP